MRTLYPTGQRIPLMVITLVTGLLFSLASTADPTPPLNTKIITQGIAYPWGMTWISHNKLLITEKVVGGWIVDINSGEKKKLRGWPRDINTEGQGGLLDVISDPEFEKNRRLYFSFSHQNRSQKFTTRVVSAELVNGHQLTNWQVLFTALPYSKKVRHYGSRLAIQDGNLFISVGDRANRHRAQDLSDNAGKIHRINTDGTTPADNPFYGKTTQVGQPIPKTIYSYGHRNPQGMFIDKEGNIWIHEHGPRGGDELNLVVKGQNYGWPVITYGREYWGPSIGEGTHKEGMQQPKYYYVPSIAPSGMVRYESDLFSEWKGDFLIGSLKLRHLNRLSEVKDPSAPKATPTFKEHRYLKSMDARIRDIEVGKAGELYLLTDEVNGKLIQVTP